MYTRFKDALQQESVYPATSAIYDFIVNSGDVVNLAKKEIFIDYGAVDDSIYFVLDGLIRGSIINKDGVERTTGFGEVGSLIFSSQCYVFGKPSLICYCACCATKLIRIPKTVLDRHIEENHEFCRWFMGALQLAVCFRDLRHESLNGDALQKYKFIKEHRPEILKHVSNRILASYLNITEVHLSRIKRQLLADK